ncbi:MAG: DUF1330 domain-containing protein [Pseudomonadota bacterium]
MTARLIVLVKSVKDADTYAKYREVSGAALAKHGAKVVQASPNPTQLEGADNPLATVAIIEFPDADAAHAWYNDPDLADSHAMRREGVELALYLAG